MIRHPPTAISAEKAAIGGCLTCVYTQADILCACPDDSPNPSPSLTDIGLGRSPVRACGIMARTQRQPLGRLSLACIACVAGAWVVRRQFDPAAGPRVASARGAHSAQTAASRPASARFSTGVKRPYPSRTRHYTDFGLAVSDARDDHSRDIDPMALCLYHCIVDESSSPGERRVAHDAGNGELDATAIVPEHTGVAPADWDTDPDNSRPGFPEYVGQFILASAIEARPTSWPTWTRKLPRARDSLFMLEVPLPTRSRGRRGPAVRYVIQPPTSTAPAEASWAGNQGYMHQ